ncbi:MAG TPA: thioesterase family protein [Holophaga sp.]|nr:thioesterase family protein [Holophaga sp.]HPS68054.1 thioesterase family protein [Holophaga sp.]
MTITVGQDFTFEKVAEPRESAAALGSGGLEVFSTPSLVALFEVTAKRGVDALLPEGHSTVGIEIQVKHQKATRIGKKVRCTATVTAVEGRKISFSGEMWDEDGRIGVGTHTRCVVNDEEFLKRLG